MPDVESKPRGGLMKKLAIMSAVVVLIGVAMGAGVYLGQSGILFPVPHHTSASKADDVVPAKQSYVTIEQGFTSNLKDSESFVQASVALSTQGDEKVVAAIKANEPALRSVILQTLAEQSYAGISTTYGREALLKRLRDLLDREMRSKVGFGGIDNVYFTAFVLQ